MNTRYEKSLNEWNAQGRLRSLRKMEPQESRMLNLSSNDYLGIGSDNELWPQFITREQLSGPMPNSKPKTQNPFAGGSCSSRLMTGNDPAYADIEQWLTTAFRREAALVFNSGYHANLGILPAITTRKDLILADKLVHASLIDGMKLSAATCIRYPHNNLDKLAGILDKERSKYDQVIIVTESVFSMDGDVSDLKALVALKHKYRALLYVDEAHSFGVRGALGLGCSEEQGVIQEVDLLVGTFGKAIASQGAFVVTENLTTQYLINTMRPLIFSTALPPWSLRWTRYVLGHLPEMTQQRARLSELATYLRSEISQKGWETSGNSHIVPLYIRDKHKVMALSELLCAQGFFVLPIRPPTVPEGTERLRISLNATITHQQINQFCETCRPIG